MGLHLSKSKAKTQQQLTKQREEQIFPDYLEEKSFAAYLKEDPDLCSLVEKFHCHAVRLRSSSSSSIDMSIVLQPTKVGDVPSSTMYERDSIMALCKEVSSSVGTLKIPGKEIPLSSSIRELQETVATPTLPRAKKERAKRMLSEITTALASSLSEFPATLAKAQQALEIPSSPDSTLKGQVLFQGHKYRASTTLAEQHAEIQESVVVSERRGCIHKRAVTSLGLR